jgi:hypothetical protein
VAKGYWLLAVDRHYELAEDANIVQVKALHAVGSYLAICIREGKRWGSDRRD